MLFYYLLLLIIGLDFVAEYFYTKKGEAIKKDKVKKALDFTFKYRLISIFAFVFLSTFKADSIGCDTQTYIEWFNSWSYESDLGYSILQLIIFKIGFSYRGMWFVISIFISVCVVLFINRFSTNKLMSLLLYVSLGVFSQSLSFMRQIVALGFLLLEIIAIDKKEWKKSALFVFLASLFHRSGLIGLLFIALKFIKINWKTITAAIVIAVVFPLLLPYISKLLEKMGFPSYYHKYFVESTSFIRDTTLIAKLYSISLVVLFFAFYIVAECLKRKKEDFNKKTFYMLGIFLFAAMFKIMGVILDANTLFDRLVVYFFHSLIIIIPNLINEFKGNKKLYILANVMCYIIAFAFLHGLYMINYYETFPFIFGF